MATKSDPEKKGQVHGEGNYEAARKYREGATKHAESEDVDKSAKRAEEALNDPEQRRELEQAEAEGRKRARN